MILSKNEAVIVEMIRNQATYKEIAHALCTRISVVNKLVSELENRSVIQRTESAKNKWKVLLDTYDVDPNSHLLSKSKRVIQVTVPKECEDYIRSHYGLIPRREIAKNLKLNKVTLNLMILNLGLEDKGTQHNIY